MAAKAGRVVVAGYGSAAGNYVKIDHGDGVSSIYMHLEHRAGKDAEGKTGDGVGILLQIGHKFFTKAAAEAGITLGGEREYGVGMFFFPQEELPRNQAKKLFEIICKKEGLPFLGWREVPTCPDVLGHKARSCMPSIWQAFVGKPPRMQPGIDRFSSSSSLLDLVIFSE